MTRSTIGRKKGVATAGKKICEKAGRLIEISIFLVVLYPTLAIALYRYNKSQDKHTR